MHAAHLVGYGPFGGSGADVTEHVPWVPNLIQRVQWIPREACIPGKAVECYLPGLDRTGCFNSVWPDGPKMSLRRYNRTQPRNGYPRLVGWTPAEYIQSVLRDADKSDPSKVFTAPIHRIVRNLFLPVRRPL